MTRIELGENALYLIFSRDDGNISLCGLSALPDILSCPDVPPLTELSAGKPAAAALEGWSDTFGQNGRIIELSGGCGAFAVKTRFSFFNGLPAVRIQTEITNLSDQPAAVNNMTVTLPCPARGQDLTSGAAEGFGAYRCKGGAYLAWQASAAELTERADCCLLRLSAPPEDMPAVIPPGKSVTALPGIVSISEDADSAAAAIVSANRTLRRRTRDCKDLPVFFDSGNAPGERLPELMTAAAGMGCNYFRISADRPAEELAGIPEQIIKSGMRPALSLDLSGAELSDSGSLTRVLEETDRLIRAAKAGQLTLAGVQQNVRGYRELTAELVRRHRDLTICGEGRQPAEQGVLRQANAAEDFSPAEPPEQTVLTVRCGTERGEMISLLARGLLRRLCIYSEDVPGSAEAALIKECTEVYRRIRQELRGGLPCSVQTESGSYPGIKTPGGRIYHAQRDGLYAGRERIFPANSEHCK